MRGIELTPEQMEAAAAFIGGRMNREPPKPHQIVSHRYEDRVRLIAWVWSYPLQGST
jgi:hypothetical protein